MALFRRGRTYWADLSVDGKRVRVSLKTKHKEEALDRYKEKLAELGRGPGPTFAGFKKQYLDWAFSAHPASAAQEEMRLKHIEAFLVSHKVVYLRDITPWHLEQLRADLKERKRSPATINRYLQIIRGMFYRAADWGVHEGPNPAKKIRFYRESPAPRLLTAGEVARIIEAAEALRVKPKSQTQRVFADLVRMAVNTGLRKSELLNLRWADVRDEGLTIKGKGEKTRLVPLNAEAQVVLERQSRRDPYVFGLSGGHRGSLFRRTVDTIRKATDIDWHFHLLRHYFSSTLLARGVDIVTVSDLLGHARVTTSLLYSHTTAERKRAAVTNLDTRARDVEPEKPRKLLKRKVPLA